MRRGSPVSAGRGTRCVQSVREGGGGTGRVGWGKERHPAPPEVVDQLEPHVQPKEPHCRLGRRARRARRRRHGRRRRRALSGSGVGLHGARAEPVLHRGPDAHREACVFECDHRTEVRGGGEQLRDAQGRGRCAGCGRRGREPLLRVREEARTHNLRPKASSDPSRGAARARGAAGRAAPRTCMLALESCLDEQRDLSENLRTKRPHARGALSPVPPTPPPRKAPSARAGHGWAGWWIVINFL